METILQSTQQEQAQVATVGLQSGCGGPAGRVMRHVSLSCTTIALPDLSTTAEMSPASSSLTSSAGSTTGRWPMRLISKADDTS